MGAPKAAGGATAKIERVLFDELVVLCDGDARDREPPPHRTRGGW